MTHIVEELKIPVSATSKVIKKVNRIHPVTVIELPKTVLYKIRAYKKSTRMGLQCVGDFTTVDEIKNNSEIVDIRVLAKIDLKDVSAHPSKLEKDFELYLSGKLEDKISFCSERMGSDLVFEDFSDIGSTIDVSSITTGRGFTGVVKRMGVKLLSHKNSKQRRAIGNLGPKRPGRVRSSVPRSGQYGSLQRTEFNKRIFAKVSKPSDINPKGGFCNYGMVSGKSILVKGSIPGPKKRLCFLRQAIKPTRVNVSTEVPNVTYISQESQLR